MVACAEQNGEPGLLFWGPHGKGVAVAAERLQQPETGFIFR